jgi:tetratricopeptide (TPR) repeat protein
MEMSLNIKAYMFLRTENPDVAKYNDKAMGYFVNDDRSKALKWCRKAIRECEKNGADSDTLATLYNNLGVIYSGPRRDEVCECALGITKDVRSFYKAKESYEKAMSILAGLGDKMGRAIVLNNLAIQYFEHKEIEESQKLLRKAADICDKHGKNHRASATVYCSVALICHFCPCDYEEARAWFKKALDVNSRLGGEHSETADMRFTVASAYRALHTSSDKALEWYEKALIIQERTLRKDHPYIRETYDAIVGICKDSGDYEKAIEWLQRYLRTSPDECAVSDAISRIGQLYDKLEDYDKALEWYLRRPWDRPRICEVYEKKGEYDKSLELHLKEYHSEENCFSCYHIGETYLMKGERDKAEEWFQRAVEICPDSDGRFFIGCLCEEQGDRGKAEEWFQRALDYSMRPYPEDEDTAETGELRDRCDGSYYSIHIGEFYEERGEHAKADEWFQRAVELNGSFEVCIQIGEIQTNPDKAEEWYNKCLDICRGQGENHPSACMVYAYLARIYIDKENYEKALMLLNKALKIYETSSSYDLVGFDSLYDDVAETHFKMKEYGKARKILKWSLKNRGDFYNPDAFNAKLKFGIGETYLETEEYEKARKWFKGALDIYGDDPGWYYKEYVILLNKIADAHRKQGNTDKALEWYLKETRFRVCELGGGGDTACLKQTIADLYEELGDDAKADLWRELAKR